MLVVLAGCASNPALSPKGQRADQAGHVLDVVKALSETAIVLNSVPAGQPGHLTDQDTRVVRDFALAIIPACNAYVETGTWAGIQAAVDSFGKALSANAKVSVTLKAVWSLVQIQLAIISPLLSNPMGGA
jgi:hypothetical protein